SDIAELAVGEQVYGVTNPQFVGAYAEYAVASAGMVRLSQHRYLTSRPPPFLSLPSPLGRHCLITPNSKQVKRWSFRERPVTWDPMRFNWLVRQVCKPSQPYRRGIFPLCATSAQTP